MEKLRVLINGVYSYNFSTSLYIKLWKKLYSNKWGYLFASYSDIHFLLFSLIFFCISVCLLFRHSLSSFFPHLHLYSPFPCFSFLRNSTLFFIPLSCRLCYLILFCYLSVTLFLGVVFRYLFGMVF